MAKMQNKPSMMVCYLCGQQFGSSSLAIHQPQCYQKHLAWWKQNDPATRGPKPKDPAVHGHKNQDKMSQQDIEAFNEQNFESYNNNLVACPNCGRTFAPDRIQVHLRSCNPGNSGGGSKPVAGKTPPRPGSSAGAGGGSGAPRKDSSASPGRPKGAKPEMLVCYLCGQQFGSSSLAIHQPQCYQKQLVWWKNNDPATRGPKPKDPATYAGSAQNAGTSGMSKEEYNAQQFDNYNSNLAACPNCGRTFAPDRLPVHLRSCNPGNSGGGSKPVAGSSRPPSKGGGDGGGGEKPSSPGGRQKGARPSMLVCYLCGQQFGTKSLAIHQPQCYKKKMAEWERNDPATRGAKPRDPATQPPGGGGGGGEGMTADEFNQQQFETYNNNLASCPNCGRTFAPDRLPIHLRSCNPAASGGGSKPVNRGGAGASQRNSNASPTASTVNKRSPLVNRQPSNASTKQVQPKACSACGTDNDPDARFCEECGQNLDAAPAPLPPPAAPPLVCQDCGCTWDSGKFCQECGGALAPPSAAPPAEPEMRCPACGELCPAVGNFCEECGEPLNKRSPMKNRLPSDASRESRASDQGGGGWQEGGATALGELPSVPDESYRPQATQDAPPSYAQSQSGSKRNSAAPSGGGYSGSEVGNDHAYDEDPEADDDGGGHGTYSGGGGGDPEEYGGSVDLVPCSICGRRFAAERLAKHENVCRKTSTKKRRVFNSTRHRTEGTDAAQFAHKVPSASTTEKKESGAWKSKSNAFREAMKQAREVKECMAAGKPLPPPAYTREEDDTRTPCPHCGRKFAPDVADRHIPKCAGTINKPKAPPQRRSVPSGPVGAARGAPQPRPAQKFSRKSR
eukprot:TRINITY_DN2151_c0_g1_i4.p1 TRINITY_DN2151_c0_g1~~TRINITY_DN2151_c0_g1_i4.p1  ORF type:complete len:885 (+),score=216.08 TRINITY_DN2151_c0_g1_i4:120-2657(+)